MDESSMIQFLNIIASEHKGYEPLPSLCCLKVDLQHIRYLKHLEAGVPSQVPAWKVHLLVAEYHNECPVHLVQDRDHHPHDAP